MDAVWPGWSSTHDDQPSINTRSTQTTGSQTLHPARRAPLLLSTLFAVRSSDADAARLVESSTLGRIDRQSVPAFHEWIYAKRARGTPAQHAPTLSLCGLWTRHGWLVHAARSAINQCHTFHAQTTDKTRTREGTPRSFDTFFVRIFLTQTAARLSWSIPMTISHQSIPAFPQTTDLKHPRGTPRSLLSHFRCAVF
jgi:hypothetical protein